MNTKLESAKVESISLRTKWDEYVIHNSKSTFFHLIGWEEAFEKVFGFKTYYLQVIEDGQIVGILPLVLVETLFAKNLFSIPIGVYGGILADREDIREKLLSEAVRVTKELGCGYLELRYLRRDANNGHKDLILKERYVTFIKELPANATECLQRLPRKARAEARYGIKGGLTYEVGIHLMEECYRLYAINQRNLGSPVISFCWFKILSEIFKDQMAILSVKKDQKTIASVLTFFFKDTVIPFYGSSVPGYEQYSPNNFMYLKLQGYAVEKGFKYFDFGRSRVGAGSYHFKIHQGFEPISLYYYYYLNKSKTVPEINPSNRLFDLPKRIWMKMPLFIANGLGPKLFKYVLP